MCPDAVSLTNSSEVAARRYEALLEIADLFAHQGGMPELLRDLASRLKKVVTFDSINFALYDEPRRVMLLSLWQGHDIPLLVMELDVNRSASGSVWQDQAPLLWEDIEGEKRFPEISDVLRKSGIHSYCVLPLAVPQHRLGAIGFGSSQRNAYSPNDTGFLSRVADLVALAIDNTLTREALQDEKHKLAALVEVNNSLASNLGLQEVFPLLSSHMGRVVAHDFVGVDVHDTKALPGDDPVVMARPDSLAHQSVAQAANLQTAVPSGEARILRPNDLSPLNSKFAEHVRAAGIRALYSIPLVTPKGLLGTLNVGRKAESPFSASERELLHQVARQLAMVLENARAYREIAELKNKLAEEKLYLEDEIRTELNFEQIVGESPALMSVLAQARTVASSDATVLILGETGTGKELIARAIHNMSERKNESFIKLNCSAIPTGLLESELFGHEKGAFTGAISQKVGRLELADRGTFFLDEIGDIPPELQPKLLRVLQDHEFERLGSNRTLKVNIRLLAATNRDLARSVAAREFRSDLYYRLNVFPIHLPPLRQRRKDIPLLVRYFVQRLAQRMNKPIQIIPSETMSALVNWDWPGNVRELENFIERSVILTTGTVLKAPLAELSNVGEETQVRRDATLQTAERDHILRVLRETGGVISGVRGAAARLGLKRTTLQSKMQKLGITRRDFEN